MHMISAKTVSVGCLLFATLMLFVLPGCGSSDTTKDMAAEARFAHAKELFDDEDYLEAINEFNVITLQNQGSSVASEAQYYLAECRYRRGEYLLAAFEFQVLIRSYSASPRQAEAQYKIGLSYYMLSPKSTLDQQYSKKSIEELQTFVETYPADPHVSDANVKIKELTERLAKKEYETARLYVTMDYYRAALMSFDEVIEKYHDTEFAPQAFEGKVNLLMARNHYREAGLEINRFLVRYPNSVLKTTMESLKETASREVELGHNVDSPPPKGTPAATAIPRM